MLVVAGSLRRGDRDRPEDQVLIRALRDFNTPTNHLGDIRIYLCNNKIEVILLNIHETETGHGQAWIYVKYPPNIDIYDTFITILNKVTHDIFQEILEKKLMMI